MPNAPSPSRARARVGGPLTILLVLGLVLLAAGWVRLGSIGVAEEGSYVEAVLGRPIRVNPLAEPANEAERDLAALVFGGLMRLRADGMPEPGLAERWEVTPDGLTYTFHLRSGVSWHDGNAFDAEDVAFTIGRIQAEGFTGSRSLQVEWSGVQVFVADSLTVLMRLPEPAADFLARATVGLVPAHLAESMEPETGFEASRFDREPVGTGPYRLLTIEGDRAVLEHNTSYVLGTPAIERLVLRFADTTDQQAEMLRDDEVDAALLPAEDSSALIEEMRADGRDVHPLRGNGYTVLYFNHGRAPLSQALVRRALAASLDPADALEAAGVAAIPGEGVIVPRSWAYPDEVEEERAPASPDTLWDATGWLRSDDGLRRRGETALTLELVTNGEGDRIALAEAIAEQLAVYGVTVEVVAEPAQRVIADYLRLGDYQLALFGWQGSVDPDPYTGWHTSQMGAGNVAGFSDPQADALLEAARTTLDTGERRELYALFLERFEELGASRVIAYPERAYVQPAALDGFIPRVLATPSSRFEDVHLWRLD